MAERSLEETEEVSLLICPIKLNISSLKALIIHQMIGEDYILEPAEEFEIVTLKLDKRVIDPLLRLIAEKRLVIRIREGKVVNVLLPNELRMMPRPRYIWQTKPDLSLLTRLDWAKELKEKFAQFDYFYVSHAKRNWKGEKEEEHKLFVRDFVELKELKCGCCGSVYIPEWRYCKKCYYEKFEDLPTKFLAWFALALKNLPIKGPFNTIREGEYIKVKNEVESEYSFSVSEVCKLITDRYVLS